MSNCIECFEAKPCSCDDFEAKRNGRATTQEDSCTCTGLYGDGVGRCVKHLKP